MKCFYLLYGEKFSLLKLSGSLIDVLLLKDRQGDGVCPGLILRIKIKLVMDFYSKAECCSYMVYI